MNGSSGLFRLVVALLVVLVLALLMLLLFKLFSWLAFVLFAPTGVVVWLLEAVVRLLSVGSGIDVVDDDEFV